MSSALCCISVVIENQAWIANHGAAKYNNRLVYYRELNEHRDTATIGDSRDEHR